MESTAGRLDEAALVSALSCVACAQLCGPPLTQCRKGHLYCAECRASCGRTCQLCKQAVATEAAAHRDHIALERLLGLIALPCAYRWARSRVSE